MAKINEAWHLAQKMPANPTEDQRLAWHLDHPKHCGCRKMPASRVALAAMRVEDQGQYTPSTSYITGSNPRHSAPSSRLRTRISGVRSIA